ncbi:hypothetical protein O181_126030, partial [Austropuccinia psidii MF-1]|nr:hypothetical protein [Austropuccinia psidii MF-1]
CIIPWLCCFSGRPQDRPIKGPAASQLDKSKKPQGSSSIPWLCQLLPPFHQELFKEDHPIPLQSFSTHHFRDRCIQLCFGCRTESGKHSISFNSRKRIPAEINYEIHDKELLGIVCALKRWWAFLLSLSSPFEVLTDHSSPQYFMSSKVLTHRQACWSRFLSEFHLSITYCPGHLATLLDALSRWDNIYPERGEDLISKNPINFQQLIKQDEVQPSRYFKFKVESSSNLIDSIQKALWQDSQYRSILQELGKGKSIQDDSLDSSSQLLLFKDWVVVPNDPTI